MSRGAPHTAHMWHWHPSTQVWTVRAAAPELLSNRRFFAPCYINSNKLFLTKGKETTAVANTAALTSQIWCDTYASLFTFFLACPPFVTPDSFARMPSRFGILLQCLSVVQYCNRLHHISSDLFSSLICSPHLYISKQLTVLSASNVSFKPDCWCLDSTCLRALNMLTKYGENKVASELFNA